MLDSLQVLLKPNIPVSESKLHDTSAALLRHLYGHRLHLQCDAAPSAEALCATPRQDEPLGDANATPPAPPAVPPSRPPAPRTPSLCAPEPRPSGPLPPTSASRTPTTSSITPTTTAATKAISGQAPHNAAAATPTCATSCNAATTPAFAPCCAAGCQNHAEHMDAKAALPRAAAHLDSGRFSPLGSCADTNDLSDFESAEEGSSDENDLT